MSATEEATRTPSPSGPTVPDATAMIASARAFDRGDLVYVAYLLLPLRWFIQLGRPLGWMEMLIHPRVRRGVRANLQQAFGATKSAREISKLTRQVFEYHQMRTLMLLVAPLMTARGQLEKHFPIRNLEHLDRALEAGKSAIIVGSHVNSVGGLLAAIQLRRAGYPVRCPMPERLDAWAPTPFRTLVHRLLGAPSLSDAIGAFYVQFNVRPLVKALNDRSILLLMGDGWHSASFVDAEFLGRMLPFTNAALSLARSAGVPVLPIFSVGPPHELRFEFEPSFVVERSTPPHEDVERKVRFYVSRVEQRMLADIPCWQHWMVEDVFGKLEGWRSRPIDERYAT